MIVIHQELYSSKNSKQIFINRKTGKPFIAKSNAYLSHKQAIQAELMINKGVALSEIRKLSTPFYVGFKIYRKTKRRFDFLNLAQGIVDEMVACGYFEDDNADIIIPFFYPHEVDSKNPRVEITFFQKK